MNLDFLSPAVDGHGGFHPVARSPMERSARAAGARIETRDGWNVAVDYGSPEREAAACADEVAWIDVSHLAKLELQGAPSELRALAERVDAGARLQPGTASRAAGAWWCALTEERALVIAEPASGRELHRALREAASEAAPRVSVVDVSAAHGAVTLVGPRARETFARFCALDLRPNVTPVRAVRPGSAARQPGLVIREDEHRYLWLFGAAVAEYIWTVLDDAARHLGGRPAGVSALWPISEREREEVSADA